MKVLMLSAAYAPDGGGVEAPARLSELPKPRKSNVTTRLHRLVRRGGADDCEAARLIAWPVAAGRSLKSRAQ